MCEDNTQTCDITPRKIFRSASFASIATAAELTTSCPPAGASSIRQHEEGPFEKTEPSEKIKSDINFARRRSSTPHRGPAAEKHGDGRAGAGAAATAARRAGGAGGEARARRRLAAQRRPRAQGRRRADGLPRRPLPRHAARRARRPHRRPPPLRQDAPLGQPDEGAVHRRGQLRPARGARVRPVRGGRRRRR